MQYLLNQTEYDEYMLLKENSCEEQYSNENQDAKDIVNALNKAHISVVETPMMFGYEYRISMKSDNMPESLELLLKSFVGVRK
jgi:hypothetical protein